MFSIGKVTLNHFSWIVRQLFNNLDAWGISIPLGIIKYRKISHYPRIFKYRKNISLSQGYLNIGFRNEKDIMLSERYDWTSIEDNKNDGNDQTQC